MNFTDHIIKGKISKANEGIGILRKLYNVLPGISLLSYSINPSFYLDYGVIIFYQPENEGFCKKIESVQNNAVLAITGATQGTSREKVL